MYTAVIVLVILAVAHAAPQSGSFQRDASGQFSNSYTDDHGSQFTDRGVLKRTANNDYVLVREGSYGFTAPDGTPVRVNYVADENGYQAFGPNIPVAQANVRPTF